MAKASNRDIGIAERLANTNISTLPIINTKQKWAKTKHCLWNGQGAYLIILNSPSSKPIERYILFS